MSELLAAYGSRDFEDSPRFEKRFDPERAEFAADARVLKSTEGRLLIVKHAVDRYASGLDLGRHATGALNVRTAHVSVEAVLRVVGYPDRILSKMAFLYSC